jgi:hypothetical protein
MSPPKFVRGTLRAPGGQPPSGPFSLSATASVRANERLLWRVNDLRTAGLLLYGRHRGSTAIGKPHTIFDAALNRTRARFLKTKASIDIALARFFALLAGFVSESLRVPQLILGRSTV